MKLIIKYILFVAFFCFNENAFANNDYNFSLTVYSLKHYDNESDEDILKDIFQYVPSNNYTIENDHLITNQQSIDNLLIYKKILFKKTEENFNLNTKFQITDNKNETKNVVFFNPSDIKKHINIEDMNDKKIKELQETNKIPNTGTNLQFKKISVTDDNLNAILYIQSIELNKSSILEDELERRHKKNNEDGNEDEDNTKTKDNDKIKLIMTQKNKTINIMIPYGFYDFFIYRNNDEIFLYKLNYE